MNSEIGYAAFYYSLITGFCPEISIDAMLSDTGKRRFSRNKIIDDLELSCYALRDAGFIRKEIAIYFDYANGTALQSNLNHKYGRSKRNEK